MWRMILFNAEFLKLRFAAPLPPHPSETG